MINAKRGGNRQSKAAASLQPRSEQNEYLTTLHPVGSANNIQIAEKKRELFRPEIDYKKAALNVLVPVAACAIFCLWNVFYALAILGAYVVLRLRGIIIWFIRLYQRYASDDIRLACVFEPSCSEYMILSLQKYGVLWGGAKGVLRLKRCHLPNGGEDYP